MAARRKTTRKPVRRRRRSTMGKITASKMTAATMNTAKAALGGVAASVLTNTLGKTFGTGFEPYIGLAGSVATGLFFKQPEIAAGMAGYAGPKVLSSLPGVGSLMSDAGMMDHMSDSMFLQGDTDVYASDYTLQGYEVPGL